MLKKISAESNALNWFEIPVNDTARAKRFYETVLDLQMHTVYMEETGDELTFFVYTPGQIQGTSGKVLGALVKSDRAHPSAEGTLVYLNASPSIQAAIEKIEPAGGKLLVPRSKILAGYIAIFIDTEGNRVGLHAEN